MFLEDLLSKELRKTKASSMLYAVKMIHLRISAVKLVRGITKIFLKYVLHEI
jgi:hypothetical protein